MSNFWLFINVYSIIGLLFSIFSWKTLVFDIVSGYEPPPKIQLFLKLGAFIFVPLTWLISISFLPVIVLSWWVNPQPYSNLISLYESPIYLLALFGFSNTLGILVNRSLANERQTGTTWFASFILCLFGCYWLPLLSKKQSSAPVLRKNMADKNMKSAKFNTSNVETLKRIDVTYWVNRNPFYGDVPLSKSMKSSLTIIQDAGFLKGATFKTCTELVTKIEEITNDPEKFLSHHQDDQLIEVFDLIHAWGGVMGRFPYVKRVVHGATPRERYRDWMHLYKSGIGLALDKKPNQSLVKFCQIPQIGTSFGSKHLYFWGGYPVLDTRMWTLFGHKEQIPYDLYLTEIDSISQSWGVSWSTAERALFGFSSHYFVNSELRFKKNIGANHIDEEVAKDLVRLSSQ